MREKKSGISIIVPFFNEEDTLHTFCTTIDEYTANLDFPVELIFVNDGSTDSSMDVLKTYKFKYVELSQVIQLSKNFGSHAAVRVGVANSNYDVCTWMGADLQEPLEIIDIAYEKICKGKLEILYFSKKTVDVSIINRFFSRIYSHLMKKYASSNYSSEGTATIAFGAKVKRLLNENVEANSSIALQIMNMGFSYENISLDYNGRIAGKSKWTFSKKIKLFIDCFVSYSYMPIRLVSSVGIIIFIIGVILGIVTIINKFVNPDVQSGYSTIACILALGFGVTNISLGIIAEYLWRTLDASRNRPVFIVDNIIELKGHKGEE